MKKAIVYVNEVKAGYVQEDESGYTFQYDPAYITQPKALPISLTLPIQVEPYHNAHFLFPFFDGLILEGWLLNIAHENWKINLNDRMSLLLACCKDCIGNVRIEPVEIKEADHE